MYPLYPDHTNNLLKAGLAPLNFPTLGELWSKQDEILDIEKDQTSQKRKTEMSTIVLPNHVIFLCLYSG